MRKPAVNFLVDSLAFTSFIFLVSTGILMYWILPAGEGYLSVWGMNRHDWGEIHFWIAVSFLALIGTHLILHWSWITSMVAGKSKLLTKSKQRILMAVISILIILFLALAPFFSPVEHDRESRQTDSPAVEMHR